MKSQILWGKWIDLECIMLSKVTQAQKEKKIHILLHMWIVAYNAYKQIINKCMFGYSITFRENNTDVI